MKLSALDVHPKRTAKVEREPGKWVADNAISEGQEFDVRQLYTSLKVSHDSDIPVKQPLPYAV